jgi:hypothetical protein
MNDNHSQHSHLEMSTHLEQVLPECPEPEKALVSPLGWSAKGRLLCAAAAAGLLWLSVAWALGWLS